MMRLRILGVAVCMAAALPVFAHPGTNSTQISQTSATVTLTAVTYDPPPVAGVSITYFLSLSPKGDDVTLILPTAVMVRVQQAGREIAQTELTPDAYGVIALSLSFPAGGEYGLRTQFFDGQKVLIDTVLPVTVHAAATNTAQNEGTAPIFFGATSVSNEQSSVSSASPLPVLVPATSTVKGANQFFGGPVSSATPYVAPQSARAAQQSSLARSSARTVKSVSSVAVPPPASAAATQSSAPSSVPSIADSPGVAPPNWGMVIMGGFLLVLGIFVLWRLLRTVPREKIRVQNVFMIGLKLLQGLRVLRAR